MGIALFGHILGFAGTIGAAIIVGWSNRRQIRRVEERLNGHLNKEKDSV